jgi:hypothetical protein
MVLLHEAVEERLLGCASHLTQLQGAKLGQAHLHWAFIARQDRRLGALAVVLAWCLAHGREFNQFSAIEHELFLQRIFLIFFTTKMRKKEGEKRAWFREFGAPANGALNRNSFAWSRLKSCRWNIRLK